MSKNNIQLLFDWVKRCTKEYPNVTITNWTKSFEDGIALLAILHYHNPAHVPDIRELKPGQNVDANLTRAWNLAEEHYGVPQLLELIDMKPPEMRSMQTYVIELHKKLSKVQRKQVDQPAESIDQQVERLLAENQSAVASKAQQAQSKIVATVKSVIKRPISAPNTPSVASPAASTPVATKTPSAPNTPISVASSPSTPVADSPATPIVKEEQRQQEDNIKKPETVIETKPIAEPVKKVEETKPIVEEEKVETPKHEPSNEIAEPVKQQAIEHNTIVEKQDEETIPVRETVVKANNEPEKLEEPKNVELKEAEEVKNNSIDSSKSSEIPNSVEEVETKSIVDTTPEEKPIEKPKHVEQPVQKEEREAEKPEIKPFVQQELELTPVKEEELKKPAEEKQEPAAIEEKKEPIAEPVVKKQEEPVQEEPVKVSDPEPAKKVEIATVEIKTAEPVEENNISVNEPKLDEHVEVSKKEEEEESSASKVVLESKPIHVPIVEEEKHVTQVETIAEPKQAEEISKSVEQVPAVLSAPKNDEQLVAAHNEAVESVAENPVVVNEVVEKPEKPIVQEAPKKAEVAVESPILNAPAQKPIVPSLAIPSIEEPISVQPKEQKSKSYLPGVIIGAAALGIAAVVAYKYFWKKE